jgi:hypothetical protein
MTQQYDLLKIKVGEFKGITDDEKNVYGVGPKRGISRNAKLFSTRELKRGEEITAVACNINERNEASILKTYDSLGPREEEIIRNLFPSINSKAGVADAYNKLERGEILGNLQRITVVFYDIHYKGDTMEERLTGYTLDGYKIRLTDETEYWGVKKTGLMKLFEPITLVPVRTYENEWDDYKVLFLSLPEETLRGLKAPTEECYKNKLEGIVESAEQEFRQLNLEGIENLIGDFNRTAGEAANEFINVSNAYDGEEKINRFKDSFRYLDVLDVLDSNLIRFLVEGNYLEEKDLAKEIKAKGILVNDVKKLPVGLFNQEVISSMRQAQAGKKRGNVADYLHLVSRVLEGIYDSTMDELIALEERDSSRKYYGEGWSAFSTRNLAAAMSAIGKEEFLNARDSAFEGLISTAPSSQRHHYRAIHLTGRLILELCYDSLATGEIEFTKEVNSLMGEKLPS